MKSSTPIRARLVQTSQLRSAVCDGLGALAKDHRAHIAEELRPQFMDSLDIDANLRGAHAAEPRWDYLVGHKRHGIIALESHGAAEKEIQSVIAKRHAALIQLRSHLRPGTRIVAWFWARSSGSGFKDTGRATRQAAQAGITFIGKELSPKHLDVLAPQPAALKQKSAP